ncbi:hypothetical protein NAEGRDRAFT_68635 [Naegleria gruberi]|uniref:Adenylate kinase active site lid domain-containing protein n=1 Tax=Naegleria gruberi TaxID=5762 RepID=D2VIC2_NAEGR|nr:uncharacterized protein NAEGRDRAFT_68635 [Naegleria gruberi]EFC43572.1 hypothetical protein NAEGRDRAFT_68635 [Naegleria gruberi]|eukprot:XP_002676316.1 hypothetical protein NAEGRDRAFT_68635 [Naegleria gruberi strain NEG-M]
MRKLFSKPTSNILFHHHHNNLTTVNNGSIILSAASSSNSLIRQFHYGRILFNVEQTTEEDQTQFRFLQRGLKFASPKLIILLGPPGSGKGTQSRFITGENPNYHIISAGDTLREESQTNPQLKELLASGKLAPEDETAKYLLKKMNIIYKEYYEQILLKESENVTEQQTSTTTTTTEQEQSSESTVNTTTTTSSSSNVATSLNQDNTPIPPNFILEGYPRNITQCKQFLTWFTGGDIHFSKPNTLILHLLVDKECIKERLKGRLIHDKSGRTYHVEFRKPLNTEKDDITGDDLSKRDDDLNDEAIVNRMETYKSQTLPTLELLIDNEFDIIDVPAIEQNIEKVRSKVTRSLIEKGFIPKPQPTVTATTTATVVTNTHAEPQQTTTTTTTTSETNQSS